MSGRDDQPYQATAARRSGVWYDRFVIVLASWLVGGIYLDGWAHNHLARLETFFTPWHALLYSGYASLALFLTITDGPVEGARVDSPALLGFPNK